MGSKKNTRNKEIEEFLRSEALSAYREEHEALLGSFRDLDSKAQATIAIAGVFLAASFAFVRQISENSEFVLKMALSLNICLLVSAILCAVLAMRLRKTIKPPSARLISKLTNDLLASEGTLSKRLPGFYGDQSAQWARAIASIDPIVDKKARLVRLAQLALVIAILCIAATTIVSTLYA